MALLSQILKGSRKLLTDVFLEWFHQFKYVNKAKKTVIKHFLKSFKLTTDFFEIVRLKQKTRSGNEDP